MNETIQKILDALVNAAAFTVFTSDAPDDEKAILTAFVDVLEPGMMEAMRMQILESVVKTDERTN